MPMNTKSSLPKKNSGMTMVEILMGFVILVLMLGMLSGIIVAATNIYYSSVDLRRAEESLQKEMYLKSVADSASTESVSLSLVPASDMPGDSTPISLSADLYKLSSITVLEDAEADTLDVNIFFLREKIDTNQ